MQCLIFLHTIFGELVVVAFFMFNSLPRSTFLRYCMFGVTPLPLVVFGVRNIWVPQCFVSLCSHFWQKKRCISVLPVVYKVINFWVNQYFVSLCSHFWREKYLHSHSTPSICSIHCLVFNNSQRALHITCWCWMVVAHCVSFVIINVACYLSLPAARCTGCCPPLPSLTTSFVWYLLRSSQT